MIKANNKIICYLKEDQSELLEECRRKNLAPKCNVKRRGGLILADSVDLFGHVPDDWRISAGYYEFASLTTSESVSRMKCGHPGNSHVKRVMTRSSRLHVRMSKNISYRLKVNELASLVRQSLCPSGKCDKPNNV